jgi:predicted NBD/HSP70 family sugar kinase
VQNGREAGRKLKKKHAMENKAQPADQKTVRRHNLGLVLDNVVKVGKRTSRARISAGTGLNPSTVSSLIGELIERGLLREAGIEQNGSIGRPGRSLELNPDGGAALGMEISDDGIGLLALDLSGKPRYRAFFNQPNREKDPTEVVRQLAELTSEALTHFENRQIKVTCTIALPGLIAGNGTLLEAPNIDWHEIPIQNLWKDLAGPLPLIMENEARLAAYAEMAQGVAQDLRSFAYISGGTGLGGGLVLDRRIFRGANGFAGEFGHVTIDRKGDRGQDTVQALAGERALADLAGLVVQERADRGDPDWVGRQIAQRATAGDGNALHALSEVGRALGIGIGVVSNLFDMEAIVLGGYLTHLSQWLRGPIEKELRARVISQRWHPTPILFSNMGREAAVRGAARWSLDTILARTGDDGPSDTSDSFQ